MYAIVSVQGFQYRVAQGETLRVPVMRDDVGSEVLLPEVHLIADAGQVVLGQPTIPAAQVRAEVLAHGRGPKLRAMKYKRRKDYRRRWGHRTNYTDLKITEIVRPAG